MAGGVVQGPHMAYSVASDVMSFRVCYRFRIVRTVLYSGLFARSFAMGTRSTNNSMQTAPLHRVDGEENGSDAGTPSNSDSLDGLPPSSCAEAPVGDEGISPALAAFIARTVQAALAAQRAGQRTPPVTTNQPSSSLAEAPNPSVPVANTTSSCFGGVPPSVPPLLNSSASNFLAAGAGPSQQGRPILSASMVVPSFVSTFAMPAMSSSVYSTGVSSLLNGATRDVADRSNVLANMDQPFVVGPGFSPVPAKLVAQIVAGKYIDLSDLLAVNLVQKEPEPQLLLDGRLVLTSQPKKQRRRIEDIASWMEAFAIFSLILVSSFPNRWKDLTQYKLLILRTYRHFSGRVWLAYDQAFREHAAATRLTDWSAMNVQLFNFHAAGSSVRSSPSSTSTESPEPPGSSSSVILCKSWNKGRCTAPFASCRYAHRCSVCSGEHRANSCLKQSAKESSEDAKRRSRSPSASGSSARAKARRN